MRWCALWRSSWALQPVTITNYYHKDLCNLTHKFCLFLSGEAKECLLKCIEYNDNTDVVNLFKLIYILISHILYPQNAKSDSSGFSKQASAMLGFSDPNLCGMRQT